MTDTQSVRFQCHGHGTGKMRNEMQVCMLSPGGDDTVHKIASDEGAIHGGAASAPPPLALFLAGLTGCLMTQMRAFAKRLNVNLTAIDVTATAEWDWTPAGRVYETAPRDFLLEVSVESTASEAELRHLVDAAQKGCFIEQTLSRPNTIRHRIRSGTGEWLTV